MRDYDRKENNEDDDVVLEQVGSMIAEHLHLHVNVCCLVITSCSSHVVSEVVNKFNSTNEAKVKHAKVHRV